MSSAICFNLDQSKLLSSDNGLIMLLQLKLKLVSIFIVQYPSGRLFLCPRMDRSGAHSFSLYLFVYLPLFFFFFSFSYVCPFFAKKTLKSQ